METPFELPDDDVTVIARAAEHGITTVPYRVEEYGSNKHRITKDIESLLCPICMDVWTNSGEHHICCNRKPLLLTLIYIHSLLFFNPTPYVC